MRPPQPSLDPQSASVLWLIRHAEVEARYQKVFGGQIDMELSPRGHDQAAALATYLHQRPLDAIYASPMRRVQQTLAPLLGNGLPEPIVLPDLREVDFGVWTGLTFEQVQATFGIQATEWLDQLDRAAIPKAESAHSLRARVEPCLRQIIARHPRQRIGIFCHGGIIRMLLSVLLHLPLPNMASFAIDYASISQVRLLPHQAELGLLNFTPWRA